MRADYDSEAGSVQITLLETDHSDRTEIHGDGHVLVDLVNDEPALIDVQNAVVPSAVEHLAGVAEVYGLDVEALQAAVQAALQAPDRIVSIEIVPA